MGNIDTLKYGRATERRAPPVGQNEQNLPIGLRRSLQQLYWRRDFYVVRGEEGHSRQVSRREQAPKLERKHYYFTLHTTIHS